MRNSAILSFLLVFLCVACDGKDGSSACKDTATVTSAQGEETAGCTTTSTPAETTDGSTGTTPDGGGTTTPDDPYKVLPTGAYLFSANIDFTNFTASQEAKVEAAIELIKKVIRTTKFRDMVLNHTFNGAKKFASTSKTNLQVYNSIIAGAETLYPTVDNEMDLQLELYTDMSSNVVGYTYPNTTKIWMNHKYFDTYTSNQVARNLIHEWSHKLGYDHDFSATSQRPYSVPYGLGTIMGQLASEIANGTLIPE